MTQMWLQIGLAPLLIAASSLAARRWGARGGGLVSSFPAIGGPFLLIAAEQHGTEFASRSADGTLLGLAALATFAVAYARAALRGGWVRGLLAGWPAACTVSAIVVALAPGPPAGIVLACGSLALARWALARGELAVRSPHKGKPQALLATMLLGTLLVAALTLLAGRVGALAAGALAGVPVLTSLLVVVAHRRYGPACAIEWLRGTLTGMAGFVLFCETIAVLIVPLGTAPAFALAAAVAIGVQAALIRAPGLRTASRRPEPEVSWVALGAPEG